MKENFEITRRQFLKGAGALVVAFSLPVELRAQSTTAARAFGGPLPPNQLDSWLMIQRDGLVTVMTGKIELGTGISTSLRQIVAEELDYPFDKIAWIQGDTANTVDQLPTFGSQTIKRGGSQLRQAAAEAKATLLSLASTRLSVPVDELAVSQGVISASAKKENFLRRADRRPTVYQRGNRQTQTEKPERLYHRRQIGAARRYPVQGHRGTSLPAKSAAARHASWTNRTPVRRRGQVGERR